MGRHRVNLVIRDPELDQIISSFLKQRMPTTKRSVFECFLSQFLEDLWKELKDDFVSFILRKAYERLLQLPPDSSLTKRVLADVRKEELKCRNEEGKVTSTTSMVFEESVECREVSGDEEDEVSLDDFLL